MIVCEQIRLPVVVLVGCFISLSRLGSLAFSMHKKSAYVSASSDPGLCRIRCCTVLHRSEVMLLMHCVSFFTYSWHLSVDPDVYTGIRTTYAQHMFACLCICWIRGRVLWVLEIAMEYSRRDGWNHPITIHLTFSQTQLVKVVTWQVQQYVETR